MVRSKNNLSRSSPDNCLLLLKIIFWRNGEEDFRQSSRVLAWLLIHIIRANEETFSAKQLLRSSEEDRKSVIVWWLIIINNYYLCISDNFSFWTLLKIKVVAQKIFSKSMEGIVVVMSSRYNYNRNLSIIPLCQSFLKVYDLFCTDLWRNCHALN